MDKLPSLYGIVMAGGSGQRFWPLSRILRPKQCLSMLGPGTMLQQACARLRTFLPSEKIVVITRKGIEVMVAKQVFQLPGKNVVAEPCGRDTAAAVTLAACILYRRDPQAVMAIVPSDHVVRNPQALVQAVKQAAILASEEEVLITVGIRPTEPATGYGYIQMGEPCKGPHITHPNKNMYHAKCYREKPDVNTARRFLVSGDYLWNSGVFVWKARTILQEIHRHLPRHGQLADALLRAKNSRRFAMIVNKLYPKLPKTSIDFGVLEKSDKIVILRSALQWDDLGSWTSLERYLQPDRQGNTLLGNALVVEGRGNLVRTDSDHLVGVLGTENLVVVHTRDATLVCSKGKVQELKKLVSSLQRNPKTKKYL